MATDSDKLIYTGQDIIVWTRINNQRLQQGLPSLTDIGYPPPADDGTRAGSAYSQYTPQTSAASGSTVGSKFTFNFGGENFTVQAPVGTTEAQARAVFENQLNTGSLAGLQPGQTLNATTQLTNGLKSAASQITGLVGRVAGGVTSAVSKLTGVSVSSPMNVADFVKVGAGVAQKIGALSATQVQGLMAQSASTANQPANAFSITQGIGKFGINPTQLESSGFLKPGTLAQFGKNATVTAADLAEAQKLSAEGTAITAQQVASNRQIKDLLQTSSVWTGKNGLTSLNSLLGDVNSQASVQVGLLSKGFNDLSKAGVIPTSLPTAQLGSLVQSAGKFGSAATALWSKGAAPADLVNQLDNLAKQGQFAVNFTDQKLPEGAAGEIVATGAKNTVNRKVLNQSVAAFIGTAKVPKINYGQPVEPPVPAPIADAPQTPTTITDSIFDSFTNKYWASTATFYPVSGTINIIINSGSGAVVYSGLAPEVQARIQQDRKADIVQDAANQKFYDDLLAVIAAQINRLKATANTQVNTV